MDINRGQRASGLQWNGVQEVFQDIVYSYCGNNIIMISKNIALAIALLGPLLHGPWLNRKNSWGRFDGL